MSTLKDTYKKNFNGRPAKYRYPDDMQLRIESYFEELTKRVKDNDGKMVNQQDVPTIVGLSLHIGFVNKTSLYEYRKKPKFTNLINRALSIIEQWHESNLSKRNPLGHTFVLKNMGGWHDKVQTDITTNGESVKDTSILTIKIIE